MEVYTYISMFLATVNKYTGRAIAGLLVLATVVAVLAKC